MKPYKNELEKSTTKGKVIKSFNTYHRSFFFDLFLCEHYYPSYQQKKLPYPSCSQIKLSCHFSYGIHLSLLLQWIKKDTHHDFLEIRKVLKEYIWFLLLHILRKFIIIPLLWTNILMLPAMNFLYRISHSLPTPK